MKRVVVIAMLFCGDLCLLRAQGGCGDSDLSSGGWKYIMETVGGSHGKVLVVVVRFSDFGCAACLDNFLDFCDSLRAARNVRGKGRVELFFSRDGNSESYQAATMKKWMRGSGIDFPGHIIPLRYLSPGRLEHSIVYLIGKEGSVEVCGRIPLPWEVQRSVIDRLFGGGGERLDIFKKNE